MRISDWSSDVCSSDLANFHDAASLQLRHEDTRFDARFRLPEVTAWMSSIANGSPLPPLSGHLSTPRLEISGAQLEGVQVTIEDPSLPGEEAPSPVLAPTNRSPPHRSPGSQSPAPHPCTRPPRPRHPTYARHTPSLPPPPHP